MLERARAYWDGLRSSLWFTPLLIVVGAGALAWSVLRLDRWVASTDLTEIAWAFGGGPESARQLLATLAGSMITLTGVTFSITLAALTLAAGQYSPRILRNFMRDRFNQTVLGVFIGTFVYCILLLRTIRVGPDAFVPQLGVTFGILLSIVCLGLFILFIHHMASSIQVSSMIHAVSLETHHEIDALFGQERAPTGPAWIRSVPAPSVAGHTVVGTHEGYVERIDVARLCALAEKANVTLDMLVVPGDFVGCNAAVAATDRRPDDPDDFADGVRSALYVGRQRTMAQDPAFGFRQLVDIAVRALSPGINDPTTACNAIDALGSLLADLADRPWPRQSFDDGAGTVRVRMPATTFDDYVTLAFAEIRRYGAGDIAATLRLLDALAAVAATTTRSDRHGALWRTARSVLAGALPHMEVAEDHARLIRRFERVAHVTGHDPAPHLPAW